MKPIRMIISGGGTGGHIFPAIAIANAVKALRPDAEILFVGALGKMEMEKVPQAGYKIEGLPIAGIQRRLTAKNLLVPFKIIESLIKSRTIIRSFRPDVAVGVGGYASGPLLRAAASAGVPTLLQEQNSYPGITNKILAKTARKICVAYEGLEQWFPKDKIVITGNPVRKAVCEINGKRERALTHFRLDPSRPVVLAVGGSLGARTINESIMASATQLTGAGYQILWQTGKGFAAQGRAFAESTSHVHAHEFITEMDLAYACADLIISRAGAMSISELCLIGKPAILVPSPHVAEDHQTKNAMALVKHDAAILVRDDEARARLGDEIVRVMSDAGLRSGLSSRILELGKKDAAEHIAQHVIALATKS
jgi:UDP-N-acetylglucosamine--N-acetylmuramyl-(pentapeptide) pyrophosphoryl-undecaprenol N-acetylglucosamine transferase